MRALAFAAAGTLVVGALAVPSLSSEDDLELGPTEEILVCDGFLPEECTVRCTDSGAEVFVSTEVRRAFVTGFGSHTLLQLQESGGRNDMRTLLVGAFMSCTLDGLRDPDLPFFDGLFSAP